MPIGLLPPSNQSPGFEDEPFDVDVIDPELNTDSEENAPQQEGLISKCYEMPGKEYLQKPPQLLKQMDGQKMVQRFLPKHLDLDKIIQRKMLKGTHFLVTINEI